MNPISEWLPSDRDVVRLPGDPTVKPDDTITIDGKAGVVGYCLGHTEVGNAMYGGGFVIKLNFLDNTGCYAVFKGGVWALVPGSLVQHS